MSNEYINSKIKFNCEVKVESNFNKANVYPYIKKEDDEIIFFLLKNETTEICFTNKALVHMFLEKSNSNFIINRYEFYRNKISDVSLEIDSNLTLNTINFEMPDIYFSISINSNSNTPIILYKTLSTLEEEFLQADTILKTANKSLLTATEILANSSSNKTSYDFKEIIEHSYNWITQFRNNHTFFDISDIYNRYL